MKDGGLDLFSSLFSFLFSDLGLGVSMISHMTVTNCHILITCHSHKSHDYMLHRKILKVLKH